VCSILSNCIFSKTMLAVKNQLISAERKFRDVIVMCLWFIRFSGCIFGSRASGAYALVFNLEIINDV